MLENFDDYDSVEDWDNSDWDEYFETFHALDFDFEDVDLGFNGEVWDEDEDVWYG